MGMMDTLLSACMAQLYTGKLQARMMCFLHTAYGIASAGVPVLIYALIRKGVPWKSIYLIPAVIAGLLAAMAIPVCLGESKPAVASSRRSSLLDIVNEARIWHLMASAFFHGIFLSGLNTWINRFFELYQSAETMDPPMSFMFIGIMCSRVILPFLPVKTEQYVRIAGFGACIATLLGILFPTALNPCILISGLLFGAFLPCLLSLGCERIPSQTLTGTTALMLAFYLGESVSSPVIGALETAFSLRVGMLFCCVCMALTSLSCIANPNRR